MTKNVIIVGVGGQGSLLASKILGHLLLPILVGVVSGLGPDVRFYRTVILEEARRPHVRTAIAKGVSPARVLVLHVLRNALVPVVTNVSLAVPFLFTGSILLESFYGLPGLGGIGLSAVNALTTMRLESRSCK